MEDDWMRKYFANKQMQKQQQQTTNNNGWKDANVNQHLLQKAMMPQQQSNVNVCMVSEGTEVYRNLATNGFYSKYPVVRSGGIHNNSTQTFEIKGTVKCIVVQGNESIDFSTINENSSCLIELVQLNAPFIGTILVRKESVVGFGGNNTKNVLFG